MTKRPPTFAELLIQGAREAAAYASGDPEVVRRSKVTRQVTARDVRLRRPPKPAPDRIRRIRQKLDVSQTVFGDLLNVSPATVRAWEQGQREPDGPSLRLLELAERDPAALMRLAMGAQDA